MRVKHLPTALGGVLPLLLLAVSAVLAAACSSSTVGTPNPTNEAGLNTVSATSSLVDTHGWTKQLVGAIPAARASVSSFAVAPNGTAVLISDTIWGVGGTNDLQAWVRRNDVWTELNDAKATFLGMSESTELSSPIDLHWASDMFVATGCRSTGVRIGISESYECSPTKFTSTDGVTWETADSTLKDVGTTNIGPGMSSDVPERPNWSVRRRNHSPTDPLSVEVSTAPREWITRLLNSSFDEVGITRITDILSLEPKVVVYGIGSVDGEGREGYRGAFVSTDGVQFVSQPVEAGCNGTLSSVLPDPSAPKPTLFAVCTEEIYNPVGFVGVVTILVRSRDGLNFSRVEATPTAWTEASIGPLAIGQKGRLLVPVIIPSGNKSFSVSIWTP
jgi:hypothetical protein